MFAVFDDLTTYNNWHDQVIVDLGLTAEISPYRSYFQHLTDPVSDPRVIVGVDSKIEKTGLTIWSRKEARDNGFITKVDHIKQKIKVSKEFADDLIAKLGAENVAGGMSRENIALMVSEMSHIQLAAQTGSLRLTRELLVAFEPTEYLSQERKDGLIAEIDAFLAEL